MAGNTFIQLPNDVTNPEQLRRFLDKLIQQIDVAFGNRGGSGFGSAADLTQVNLTLSQHTTQINNLSIVTGTLVTDVADLQAGNTITTTTTDLALTIDTPTVLCDCTSNAINITLPDPTIVNSLGRSVVISISKIDTTSNKVNILPFSSEVINGFDLLHSNEIINLVSDGTNWYLGA